MKEIRMKEIGMKEIGMKEIRMKEIGMILHYKKEKKETARFCFSARN